jgi:hypothetical protein
MPVKSGLACPISKLGSNRPICGDPQPKYMILPSSQIISHSKNLGESKHLKFDQNYKKNYKDL